MIARRPLSPREILSVAQSNGLVPDHLHGATMHRTLNARLSENIRYESGSSEFFRTAPSTFFIHTLARNREAPDEYRRVYRGHLRSKSIRKENVLVAPRLELSRRIFGEYTPYDEGKFSDLYASICRFADRSQAEEDSDVKQFVTFTLVFHDSLLLTYRRGKFTTTSDLLKGQMSVGFGGHVNDKDFTLFSRGGDAFRSNAARELKEELFLDEVYGEQREAVERARVMGYINVDDSPDAERHIAVLVAFEHSTSELPKKGELSINQLSWLDLRRPLNDLSDFDLWSGIILRNLYEGRIRVR
jgi:predicted NUDIX family phosphoesterase